MPDESSWQTSFLPSQQFWLALIFPPPGNTGAPQMFPTPLHDVPLSHRPLMQRTLPLGFIPPPQHSSSELQLSPVRRQPPAGRHTFAPVPGSAQMRLQQLEPLAHGLPPCRHPPPPPPVMKRQVPAVPSLRLQARPQQSRSEKQMSPFAWQLKAGAHCPSTQRVEQHSAPLEQDW